MADKVLRFTAEDSGYGATIDRMAGKLRSAFSGAGLGDILAEADAKFTNFQDKLKFIRDELNTIKEANEKERTEAVKEATGENQRGGYKRSNDAVQKQVSREFEKEEKSINRLTGSLDKLGDKIEEANEKDRKGEGEQPPPIVPPVEPKEGGGGIFGGGAGGFLAGALTTAIGFGIERIAEGALRIITNSVKEGVQLARTENQQRTFIPGGTDGVDLANSIFEIGASNKEFLEARSKYALSRRSGGNINDETINRLRLLRSNAAVSDEQIAGLDRFYRVQQGGGLLDRSGQDATRTIAEIISRADRQGILGVSKGDFTMLPEKIGQVTSIMQQQYQNSERTNANAAVNLMLAGNKIGGRFADDRAADTFGRLNEGIANPRSPGMRAFVLEALRRANPNIGSPLQLEGIMQEGLSNEGNTRAIFGALQNIRSREVRGRILQSMGLDAQSAFRLASSDNLQAFLQQVNKGGLTTEEYKQFQSTTQQKAQSATLNTDKLGSYFSNAVTAFGESVVQFVNGVNTENGSKNAGTKPQNNGISTNKIIPAGGAKP